MVTPFYRVTRGPNGIYVVKDLTDLLPTDADLAHVNSAGPKYPLRHGTVNAIKNFIIGVTIYAMLISGTALGKQNKKYLNRVEKVITPSGYVYYTSNQGGFPSGDGDGNGSNGYGSGNDDNERLNNIANYLNTTPPELGQLAERMLPISSNINFGKVNDDNNISKKGNWSSKYLERLIFGTEIGGGSDPIFSIDSLVPVYDGNQKLLFANFVPYANSEFNNTGMIIGLGYRTTLDDGTELGIIPAVDFNRTTNNKTYIWPQINFELEKILGTGIGLNATYLWETGGEQRVGPNRFENPEGGLILEPSIDIGNNFKVLPRYDFRKGGGLGVSLLLNKKLGSKEVQPELTYRRIGGENMFFFSLRIPIGSGRKSKSLERRVRWKKPIYSRITVPDNGIIEPEPPDTPSGQGWEPPSGGDWQGGD